MRTLALVAVALFAMAAPAFAQREKPLPRAVVDLRGFFSGLSQDPITASQLDPVVAVTDLPNRALGGVVGGHLYLLRGRSLALGVGVEAVTARSRAQQTDDDTGQPVGPPITQRMRGVSGNVSLNFGHRDGWSYVTAGMGPLSLFTYNTPEAPADDPPSRTTIVLGAGARWFASPHLAFCFDLRFYQTRPETPSGAYPGRQRANVRVLSAGVSIR